MAKANWDFSVVVDLKPFVTALKHMEGELPKRLRVEFKTLAEKVAAEARSKYPFRTGAAQGSIRTSAQPMGASILIGGGKAPYAPWLDFGGNVGRRKSVQRPFIKSGRYLYPAIAAAKDETAEAVDKAIIAVAKEAGFEAHA